MQEISFTLSGSDTLIWHPNVDALKTELLGKDKIEAESVFAKYTGIASANIAMLPPWAQYLPSDASRVNINVK